MSIQKQVQQLEEELFGGLIVGFHCLNHKQPKRLALVLTAIQELEKEYKKITKVNFIKTENIQRLETGLKEMTGNVKSNQAKPK